MSKFIITGSFKKGFNYENFKKEVEAPSERMAIHKVKSKMASDYKILGHMIKIKEIKVVK